MNFFEKLLRVLFSMFYFCVKCHAKITTSLELEDRPKKYYLPPPLIPIVLTASVYLSVGAKRSSESEHVVERALEGDGEELADDLLVEDFALLLADQHEHVRYELLGATHLYLHQRLENVEAAAVEY